LGDGASDAENLKRQFVQRSLMTATAGASAQAFDPLDPESVAARQRAARQMREGLNSSYGTSTRGTDLPQGGGLKGPADDPIISAPNVATQPGTNAILDAASEAARKKADEELRLANTADARYRNNTKTQRNL
jgi:hypothetical protein